MCLPRPSPITTRVLLSGSVVNEKQKLAGHATTEISVSVERIKSNRSRFGVHGNIYPARAVLISASV